MSQPQPNKTKVEWEIDTKLLGFIRLVQRLNKKEHITEADYVSGLIALSIKNLLTSEKTLAKKPE